jgi:hypothetical protein
MVLARASAVYKQCSGARTMAESDQTGWRELCAAAAKEPDSEKLVNLVDQIIHALDAHREGLVSPKKFRTA